MLKLTQQEFTGLPQQLHLELLVSITLCLIGEALLGPAVDDRSSNRSGQLADMLAQQLHMTPVRTHHQYLSSATCRRLPCLRQHEANRAQQRNPVSVCCRLCQLHVTTCLAGQTPNMPQASPGAFVSRHCGRYLAVCADGSWVSRHLTLCLQMGHLACLDELVACW